MSDIVAPSFLPWLRTGLSTQITDPVVDGLAAHDTTTAVLSVELHATGTSELTETVPSPDIRLRGPGEVIGIDQSLVVRRDPEIGTADAESTYLALVEFGAPDLPWRYTPAAPALDRLQPWIALVVVEERDGVRLEAGGTARLPVLHVDDASRELPDLRQCWAWAHVHAETDLTAGVVAALDKTPEAFRSRLLSPRRLLPQRSWLACVVPTFAAGRASGLGQPITADMGLAWDTGDVDVQLPVYYSWRFKTGEAGDFESLVRRLTARELPATVGRRDLDISEPGGGLPAIPGSVISYQGALVSPAGAPRPWLSKPREAMKNAIRVAVNARPVSPAIPALYDALRDDPVVGPPAYVAAQAAQPFVPVEGRTPVWFETLNTEPQHRAVAGVATEVIRRDQEKLMAVAWDYAAGAVQTNQVLNPARAAWEGARRLRPRLESLSDEVFIQFASPAMARLAHPSGRTIQGVVRDSALPAGLVSGSLRRLTHTVIARGNPSGGAIGDVLTRTALGSPVELVGGWADVWPPAGADIGGVEVEQAQSRRGPVRSDRASRGARARTAVAHDYVLSLPASPVSASIPYSGETTPIETLADDTRAALDPQGTIAAMVTSRIRGLDVSAAAIVPGRVFVRPAFTTAMYRRLVALSIDYLVPGVGDVPADTLGLLETNPAFVEAFLGGANHAIGGEFLWREYPARLEDTWFQQFWESAAEGNADILAIDAWGATAALGANAPKGAATASLVLLVKSTILRRYPDLRIYAVEAQWEDGVRREAPEGDVKLPVFEARLAVDIGAFGFDLTEEVARGSTTPGTRAHPLHPGYFFVLEQPVGKPRFGLDAKKAGRAGKAPANWTSLSWSNLAAVGAELPSFVDPTSPDWLIEAGARKGNGGSGASGKDLWGEDAAAMARILFQRPVRMLVHADAMLPASVPPTGGK